MPALHLACGKHIGFEGEPGRFVARAAWLEQIQILEHACRRVARSEPSELAVVAGRIFWGGLSRTSRFEASAQLDQLRQQQLGARCRLMAAEADQDAFSGGKRVEQAPPS